MAGNFILDVKGFAEMAVGPEVAAAVLAEARRAQGIAEGLSSDFVVTGDYIASFEAFVEIMKLPGDFGGRAHDAIVGVLENFSDHAVGVEYGFRGSDKAPTKENHRIFGRTLALLGA